jgi:hypothetical protein
LTHSGGKQGPNLAAQQAPDTILANPLFCALARSSGCISIN